MVEEGTAARLLGGGIVPAGDVLLLVLGMVKPVNKVGKKFFPEVNVHQKLTPVSVLELDIVKMSSPRLK